MNYAFDDFYKSKHLIYGRILKSVKSLHDADDVFQNVCLKVYCSLNQEIKSPENWINRITSNAISDWFRFKRSTYPLLEDICSPEIEEVQDYSDYSSKLSDSMACLNQEQREILKLHYFRNISQKEIAHNLNLSHSAIKQKVRRAKRKLKDVLVA